MRKNLLYLFVLALFGGTSTLYSQSQTISFETSEGYNTGPVTGQNGWQTINIFGTYNLNDIVVTTAQASNGTQGLLIPHNGNGMAYIHTRKDISAYGTYTDVEISGDVYFTTGGSTTYINILNNTSANQVCNIIIGNAGTIAVWNSTGTNVTLSSKANTIVTGGQWHTFKIVLKKSTNTIDFYIDNVLWNNPSPLGLTNVITAFDVLFTNQGTSVYFDNLKFTNITAGLATSEVSKKEDIQIFPNPTVDKINFSSIKGIQSAILYDFRGGLVRDFGVVKSSSVDISDLPTGNYLLKLKTQNSEMTKKIIKE